MYTKIRYDAEENGGRTYLVVFRVDEPELWTGSKNFLHAILGRRRSDGNPVNVVHQAEVPHRRFRTGEQFAQIAEEAEPPADEQSRPMLWTDYHRLAMFTYDLVVLFLSPLGPWKKCLSS